jgi:holo-[acyl-carrier protein] synthase
MIIAHGVDLVDIAETECLLAEPTEQFLTRCFTAGEQADVGTGIKRAARLSSRFAVKEAVMKALGTGFSAGVGFLDIEVTTLTSGAPSLALRGEAKARADELGIVRWLVSSSHEAGMAIGSVIALSD